MSNRQRRFFPNRPKPNRDPKERPMAVIVMCLALVGCGQAEPEYAIDLCDFAETYSLCMSEEAHQDKAVCANRSKREAARLPGGIPEGCK